MVEPVRTGGAREAGRGRSLAVASGLLLAGATAPAAEAAPRGRVVRVERAAAGAAPRLCAIRLGGEAVCFGQPRKGERIAVLDLSKQLVRGELVIESVGEAAELISSGVCVSTGAHLVKGSYARGTESAGDLVGLRGATLDPRIARVLTDVAAPSGRAEESVELAVDRDGNGRADVIVTRYACDEHGKPAAGRLGRCIDTFMEWRGELRRVQQDLLRVCR